MNKIIKALFIVTIYFISITLSFAATCDSPTAVITNKDEEIIECKEDESTVVKFNYPKNESTQIKSFENEYCQVVCKESLNFSFNGIRSVYAGKGFSYPLNMSATRTCQAEYKNVEDFDKLFRELIDSYLVLYGNKENGIPLADVNGDGYMNNTDYLYVRQKMNSLYTLKDLEGNRKKVLDFNNDGIFDENAHNTLLKVINDMNGQKNICNVWGTTEESKYKPNPEVSLEISTSTNTKNIKYEYTEKNKISINKTTNESTYVSCALVISESAKLPSCKGETSVTGWNEVVNISGQYNMPECRLELYTGKIINKGQSTTNPTCLAGNKFFVSYKELSRPNGIDDKTDKGYPLKLTVRNIGNNIDNVGTKNMSLNVNCFYKVLNLASPTSEDYVSKTFGNSIVLRDGLSMFDYRNISLTNPFPERNPLSNWNGNIKVKINGKESTVSLKDYYITSSGNSIRNNVLYTIDFNRSTINSIREYNKSNPYGIFNLNPENERSYFLENSKIITRGK